MRRSPPGEDLRQRSRSLLAGFVFLISLGLFSGFSLVGCSGVFDEVSPPEKDAVPMVFLPDFVRVGDGEIEEVDAFIDVPAENTFVTDIDLGPGIQVVAFDSRNNQGCGPQPIPAEIETENPFRLCVSLRVEPTAEIGERTVTIEVRNAGEPRVGQGTFFVLRGR